MGLIPLPSLDEIESQKDPNKKMEMLINTLGILMKDLRELNGYIGGANIRAKSIQAEKMDVNQLSAITANLGEITAGIIRGIQIFGSYISTSETFPRTEMDVTGNFLAAKSSANTYLSITPQGTGNVPAISIVALNNIVGFLNRAAAAGTSLGTFSAENLNLQAAGSLNASANGNMNLNPSGNLQVNGINAASGTFFVSATNGGPNNVQVSFTKGLRIT